jgi:PqqD family protein of HPr-rel-A system
MDTPPSTAWQVSEGCQFVWQLWDDEYVVFDHGSGNTHFLDPVAAEALQALVASPADLRGLTQRIGARIGVEADPAFEQRIRETLDRFREAGLVEPSRT